MKKMYQKPDAEWVSFCISDVLTLSNGGQGAGDSDNLEDDLFSSRSTYQIQSK